MNIISKYEQKEIVIFLDEKINQNNEDKLFNKILRKVMIFIIYIFVISNYERFVFSS